MRTGQLSNDGRAGLPPARASNGQFHFPHTGQCSSARKATKPH
ncbi:hypothetical protein [Burkholderia ubonensis]|nr:hypothetical protein [Burkholderia ubonensis]